MSEQPKDEGGGMVSEQEPVAEVHPNHLKPDPNNAGGHFCRNVLLYSGNSPHDWRDGKNTRVKLYLHPAPAEPAAEVERPCCGGGTPDMPCVRPQQRCALKGSAAPPESPSAEVERVMGLYRKALIHRHRAWLAKTSADIDAFERTDAALRAEVERLVRERDMWRDERLQQIKRVGQECDDWRTRAEAAEQAEDALIALGADSYSALYGLPVHTAERRDECGEPFGVKEAIAAIREEQAKGRAAWAELQQLKAEQAAPQEQEREVDLRYILNYYLTGDIRKAALREYEKLARPFDNKRAMELADEYVMQHKRWMSNTETTPWGYVESARAALLDYLEGR